MGGKCIPCNGITSLQLCNCCSCPRPLKMMW